MVPSGTESKNLRDLLLEDIDEAVNYESETDFMRPNGSPLTNITGEYDTTNAPSRFPKRNAAHTLTALRFSPDVTSSAMVDTILSMSNSNKSLLKKIARSIGQRPWPNWPAQGNIYVVHSRLRNGWTIPIGMFHWAGGHHA